MSQAAGQKGLRFGAQAGTSAPWLKRAYVMGDLHFNNHQHSRQQNEMKTSRPRVVEEFDQILASYVRESRKGPVAFKLVLNGDIFDLTDSWPASIPPQHLTDAQRNTVVKKVLDEILDNNPEILDRFRRMLSQPGLKIHYVLGNHERWLSDISCQNHLKRRLGLSPEDPRLTFTRQFYDRDLQLMALHGDQFDRFCAPPKEGLNDAEKLDILVMKPLLLALPERLRQEGYPPRVIAQVVDAMQSVEYVRPIHQGFAYLYDRLRALSDRQEAGDRRKSVLRIVLEETAKVIPEGFDQQGLVRALDFKPVRNLFVAAMNNPTGERILNHVVSSRVRQVRADDIQTDHARKLLEKEARDKPIRVLALAHTHKVLDKQVPFKVNGQAQTVRVVNPGSYKTTIFYPNQVSVYPAGLITIQKSQAQPDSLTVDLNTSQRRLIATA